METLIQHPCDPKDVNDYPLKGRSSWPVPKPTALRRARGALPESQSDIFVGSAEGESGPLQKFCPLEQATNT